MHDTMYSKRKVIVFTPQIIQARKKYHDDTRGNHLKIFSTENRKTDETSVPDYDAPSNYIA